MLENIADINSNRNLLPTEGNRSTIGWSKSVFTLITIISVNLIYFFRINHIIGQFNDDAFYLVLAKSIAEHGTYQLISSPIQGIQPVYPPGFPLILAVILRLVSLKPDELWMLKGISIVAMNLLGIGMFVYCRKVKEYPLLISWLASLMIAIIPAFVFIATSYVLSECVFACTQLWAVVYVEKIIREKKIRFSSIGILLLLAATTYFTRSLGVALVIGIAFQLWRYAPKKYVVTFIIGIGLMIGAWGIYTKFSYPNQALRANHGGHIVIGYTEQLTYKVASDNLSGFATASDYFYRVTGNFGSIVGRDMLGLFIPATLRDETRSGEEVFGLGGVESLAKTIPFALSANIISWIFSLIILIGFIFQCRRRLTSVEVLIPLTLALIVIWPWLTFRFVLPLAPFLIAYFIDGSRVIARWLTERFKRDFDDFAIVRIALFCFIFFFALEHVRYIDIFQTNRSAIPNVKFGLHLDETCRWMRDNLPENAIVASTNPAKVYLMTNRLAVSGELTEQAWNYWQQRGIRYMAVLRGIKDGPLEANEGKYKTVFATATTPSLHVIDLGDPARRESWKDFNEWCRKFESKAN